MTGLQKNIQQSTKIDQISLFKLRKDITLVEYEELVHVINTLKAIPGVLSTTIDRNIVEPWIIDPFSGFTHALRIRFSSKNALRFYQDHPLQVGVQNYCLNFADGDSITLYFEVPNNNNNLERERNQYTDYKSHQKYIDSEDEKIQSDGCLFLSDMEIVLNFTLSFIKSSLPI